ncbi:MAG: adenylyl-sulfate kinase [Planctomycetes bacterium]|nr:adenylyl-sulfate kinase [Planctomycetota bacterium]
MQPRSQNIVFHHGEVSRADRERLLGQRGCVLWFTGLSGSGKSTVARAVERRLFERKHPVQVLDGDNVRHGLCKDLGFSATDRTENIRRIAELAALSVDAGLIVLTAFISPFRADRAQARAIVGTESFVEVFVDVPLAVCESRDPKGLYKKVRRGELAEFTGISSPYEAPDAPELVLRTADLTLDRSVDQVIEYLDRRLFLGTPGNPTR